MADVVVTVPKKFGLARWIAEGDPAGSEWSGTEWGFTVGRRCPNIMYGERVYIVCEGHLRGYAPLVRVELINGVYELVRRGGAVAVTLPWRVVGFQGFRYRWWERSEEIPFANWRIS